MRVAITYSATQRTSHLLQSIQQITTGWRLAGDNLTVLCPTSGRVAGDLQLTAVRPGRFPASWKTTFFAVTRYWDPTSQETFSTSAFFNPSAITCTARWILGKPGRASNPTATQEEETNSGSRLIRPAAPVTASNTRFGARLRPATSVGSSVGRPMTGLRGSLPLVFLSRQCGEPWTWTPTAMSL